MQSPSNTKKRPVLKKKIKRHKLIQNTHDLFSLKIMWNLRTGFQLNYFVEHLWTTPFENKDSLYRFVNQLWIQFLGGWNYYRVDGLHVFFICNTFVNNAMLKLTKKITQKPSSTMRLKFYYLKIIRFLHPLCHP